MDIITYSDAVHHNNGLYHSNRYGKPNTVNKSKLSSRDESLIVFGLLAMLTAGFLFFYFPILKLNWGLSSIRAISFWEAVLSKNSVLKI